MSTFQDRLKQLRKKAGITQAQIGKDFNTTQQSYAQWEKGLRKPSSENLQKLAEYFQVSTDYLLGNTNDPTPPSDELDFEKVKKSLKSSLGYTGSVDIPEEELDNMALAFIEHFKNSQN